MMQRVRVISLLCGSGVAALVGCRNDAPYPPVATAAPVEHAQGLRMHAEPVTRDVPSGHVTVSASVPEQRLDADSTGQVRVELQIEPSFHLYGPLEASSPFTPMSVEVLPGDETVSAGRPQIAEATTVQDGLPVYRHSVTAEVPLQFTGTTPGEVTLEVRVRFQACNDLICLPPEDLVLELPVTLTTSQPSKGDSS